MKKLIVIIALFLGAIAHAQTEADIRNDEAFQQILEKILPIILKTIDFKFSMNFSN